MARMIFIIFISVCFQAAAQTPAQIASNAVLGARIIDGSAPYEIKQCTTNNILYTKYIIYHPLGMQPVWHKGMTNIIVVPPEGVPVRRAVTAGIAAGIGGVAVGIICGLLLAR